MTKWQDVAKRYEGQAEVAGAGSNPVILGFIQAHGRPDAADDSATPWCGFFMAAVFTEAGLAAVVPKEPGAAKSWRSVGERLAEPREGAIVVLPRNDPANPDAAHVGIVDSFDATHIRVRGGNQGNAVSVATFPRNDLGSHYRWPVAEMTPGELAANGSRIAGAAQRQQRDAAIGGTAGGSTQLPVPNLGPDLGAPLAPLAKAPPAAPPKTGGLGQAIDSASGDLGSLKRLGTGIVDFATYAGMRWQWVALGVAAYFGLRFLYDSRMIAAWRAEDHNKGYST